MAETNDYMLFHRRYNKIMKIMMAEFHLAILICACWLTTRLWVTETLEYNRDIVSIISNTCAIPTMTSQNVKCY